ERGISARSRLQPVIKVEHYFVQRQFIQQQHAAAANVFEFLLNAALLFKQLQNFAQVFLASDNCRIDDRLLRFLHRRWLGELLRIIHLDDLAGSGRDPVAYTGRGRDQIDLKLAFQTFLHNLKVKQAEKSAAESETESSRTLRLKIEGAIV